MFPQQEVIRPSADLRNHYNEISRQCREENEAVIITVNGRGDTVSLAYEEYKRMKARIEVRSYTNGHSGFLNSKNCSSCCGKFWNRCGTGKAGLS